MTLREEYSGNRRHDETYEEFLERLVTNLREGAAEAASWFREYETLHRAKAPLTENPVGRADTIAKAERNRERAEALEALR